MSESDNLWRQSVDTKLDKISSSLETLIRVEEKQTAMMASHEALQLRVDHMSNELQASRSFQGQLDSLLFNTNETSKYIRQLEDKIDNRLDALEQDVAKRDWATKSIERLVAFAAVVVALLSHFIDLGD